MLLFIATNICFVLVTETNACKFHHVHTSSNLFRGRRDRMVVGFITTYMELMPITTDVSSNSAQAR